ncbi:hypothetical protein IFM47457_02685 [Aspergillus lentulus]|nr:hypothetical protein IFM47457_02685 [Aspergillus lentulus]
MPGIAGAKRRPEPAAAPSPAPSTAPGTRVVGFTTASDTNSTRASVTSDDGGQTTDKVPPESAPVVQAPA